MKDLDNIRLLITVFTRLLDDKDDDVVNEYAFEEVLKEAEQSLDNITLLIIGKEIE